MTSIHFPSASNKSKLSACPTTKIPQGTDWIYQDFFHTMLNTTSSEYKSPSIQISELFPNGIYNMVENNLEKKRQQETSFSEALLQVVMEPSCHNNIWDYHHIDYSFCPTSISSTYDQVSLPDLDNTKSGISSSSEDEDEEDEEDNNSMIDCVPSSDFSLFMNVAPVLIESTISSCTTSSEDAMSFRYNLNDTMETTNNSNSGLNKRKSTSSFQSLRSFMNVFASNKKSKFYHSNNNTTSLVVKKDTMTGTLTKKFKEYFNRRRGSRS